MLSTLAQPSNRTVLNKEIKTETKRFKSQRKERKERVRLFQCQSIPLTSPLPSPPPLPYEAFHDCAAMSGEAKL